MTSTPTTDDPGLTTLQAYRRFAPAMRGERRSFVTAGVLLGSAALCEILSIFVLSDVINGALDATDLRQFALLALLWLGITAVSTAADYQGQILAVGVSERVVLRLRDNLFRHVQRLDPVTHRRFGIGDLATRHGSDLDAVEHMIGSGVLTFVIAGLNAVGLVIAAFAMSWQVALVALAAVPLLWIISAYFGRHQTHATRDERSANSDIAVAVTAAMSGHETAVAYNQQAAEHATLHRHGRRWLSARMMQTRIEVGFGAALGFGEVIVTLAIAVCGVWQVREGALSVGELLALTAYLGMLYPKMQQLADIRLSLAAALVSADRIAELEDLPPVDDDAPHAFAHTGGSDLRIDDVTVRREGITVLEHVSMRLMPGEITALTGPSGAGKSTIAALVCRFIRPDHGRILLGGNDLRDLTARSIRDTVTLLPQDVSLKAGTIADNIAYGRPAASRVDVVAAAIAADADDFISALPSGYDTLLDEEGITLSGGQRRRLAIARAMVRDTPVLVLDEPTAGLDAESATRVLEPLRRLAAGRTTLLITHDTQVSAIADTVLRLDGGQLHDASTHVRGI